MEIVMTTEDDFQRMLDANPDDWQTRLILADWLRERNDPRADGYEALARNRLRPRSLGADGWPNTWKWYVAGAFPHSECPDPKSDLPENWFNCARANSDDFGNSQYISRRNAEDEAAEGFIDLPVTRRAELLKGVAL
jgi:uncharacterized protein (TIGR02996 family)